MLSQLWPPPSETQEPPRGAYVDFGQRARERAQEPEVRRTRIAAQQLLILSNDSYNRGRGFGLEILSRQRIV